jgi:hypothetical protein
MKIGKWTIVVDDKRIIKQYGNGIGIGYEILDNNLWLSLNQNIFAIQYTGDPLDHEQVEYRDETQHSIFSGDIKIFSDKWDQQHLLNLQNIWDNNYVYEEIPNPKLILIDAQRAQARSKLEIAIESQDAEKIKTAQDELTRLENPKPTILVLKQETIEQKITRLGPRPDIYISEI